MNSRDKMIETQLKARGISNPRVLDAFAHVSREKFVPENRRDLAYADKPLGIGYGVTISQPYIVAKTLEAANLQPGQRVLEIGTGSGYQTALLSQMGCEVYTIEVIRELATQAKQILNNLGYQGIHFLTGNGYLGWPDPEIQFEAIVLSAAPEKIPTRLIEQLKIGGMLVGPEGEANDQWLVRLRNSGGEIVREQLLRVSFVPMINESDS